MLAAWAIIEEVDLVRLNLLRCDRFRSIHENRAVSFTAWHRSIGSASKKHDGLSETEGLTTNLEVPSAALVQQCGVLKMRGGYVRFDRDTQSWS